MIKDLRKIKESVDLNEIKKEAYLEAYETILKENVVLTEDELERSIKEGVENYKKSIKDAIKNKDFSVLEELVGNENIFILSEDDVEVAEQKFIEKIDQKLEKEKVDVTLPERHFGQGKIHPVSK